MELRTQDFLAIQDIKDDVVILKNNQIRGIMMVSSVNFALKSDESQNAIIYAFQSFLNSLDFFCQIVIQSRAINITPYLDTVKALEEQQTNELLKTQTSSYMEFIKELVKGENIVTKSFYIIVPFALTEALGVGGIAKQYDFFKFLKSDEAKDKSNISPEDFEKCKVQLWQRMEFLANGLRRCGLEAAPLSTPELIELFWAAHHPTEAEAGYYPEIAPELLK